MRHLRPFLLLVAACLLLAPIAAVHAEDRLGEAIRPTFQTIDLRIDPSRPDYSGSVRIELQPVTETRAIRLHAEEMEIVALRLVDRGTDESLAIEHRMEGRILVVEAAAALRVGRQLALEVDFTNDLGTRSVGLYRVEHDGSAYVSSQFQADDAREAFPCFDEPAFKIPFRVALEVPAGDEAISNAPIASESPAHEGFRRVVFEQTAPLPSYLLAIAVGPWESVPVPDLGVPARIVVPRGMTALAGLAAEATGPILADMEEWFGRPYPYRKLDQIAVPDFAYGAMENAGAITYRDDILLLDPATASVADRAALARVVAHELAHMWFGDLVTMTWWDDLWLNESFADWMADASAQRVFPELGIALASLRGTEGTMARDALPGALAIRRPIEATDELFETVGLAYRKGKRILSMIEAWIGPDAFREGVRAYLDAHAWGSTRAADLWSALSAAAGLDTSEVLRSFLDQPGLPLVHASLDGDRTLVLRQERYAAPGSDPEPLSWQIPVALQLVSGDTVTERTVLLSATPLRVPLAEPADWVLPHAGARGWYRWSVPDAMLERIAAEATERLDPEERVAFLGNALTLLESGRLGADRYLELLRDFGADPHPEVLRTALDGLGRVREPLVTEDLEDELADYVRASFRPALDRIGLLPRDGEPESVARVRPILLAWLGARGGDPEVLDFARRETAARLAGGDVAAPSLLGTSLAIAAAEGDHALFDALREAFLASDAPTERGRLLDAIASFEDPDVRAAVLRFALDGPLRPQEILPLAGGIADDPAGREMALEWVRAHFDALVARVPPPHVLWMPQVADGCSRDLLERSRQAFASLALDEGLRDRFASRFDRIEEGVEQCLALRESQGEAAARWLSSAAAGR